MSRLCLLSSFLVHCFHETHSNRLARVMNSRTSQERMVRYAFSTFRLARNRSNFSGAGNPVAPCDYQESDHLIHHPLSPRSRVAGSWSQELELGISLRHSATDGRVGGGSSLLEQTLVLNMHLLDTDTCIVSRKETLQT